MAAQIQEANLPNKESLKLASRSAKKITAVKIEAETVFNFDVDYENSNSVDREFMKKLVKKEDLSSEYIKQYIHG